MMNTKESIAKTNNSMNEIFSRHVYLDHDKLFDDKPETKDFVTLSL
jgi:hypothetical protein